MLADKFTPVAQSGEDQTSPGFAARSAHWGEVRAGIHAAQAAGVTVFRAPWAEAAASLLQVTSAFADKYLGDERDDAGVCVDSDHHAAVLGLFDAIRRCQAVDLACVGMLKDAAFVGEPRYWFTNFPEYEAKSVVDLVAANKNSGFTMRPGDAVYVAEIRRHTLTDADLDAAARVVIGGAK